MQSAAVAKSLEEEGVASLLAPPTLPPPVFFCTIEPSSAANQKSRLTQIQSHVLTTSLGRFGGSTAVDIEGGSQSTCDI